MGIVVGGLKTLQKNVGSDATYVLERRSMQRLERGSGYRRVIRMR